MSGSVFAGGITRFAVLVYAWFALGHPFPPSPTYGPWLSMSYSPNRDPAVVFVIVFAAVLRYPL